MGSCRGGEAEGRSCAWALASCRRDRSEGVRAGGAAAGAGAASERTGRANGSEEAASDTLATEGGGMPTVVPGTTFSVDIQGWRAESAFLSSEF